MQSIIKKTTPAAREVATKNIAEGISIPAYVSAVSYFDAVRNGSSASNLIQAQRDYFGAHTYELVGKEGVFHTEWMKEEASPNPSQEEAP